MKPNIQDDENVRSNSTPLLGVLFDVDGTLADTESNGHRIAFNRAFEEFDLNWHWTTESYGELLATVAGGKERIRHFAMSHPINMPNGAPLDNWITRLHQRKSEIYSKIVMSGAIPLRPGVARLLHELREAGIRVAIATTTTTSSLRSLIKANLKQDMTSLFDVIGAGDQVLCKKPAPDIYLWALRQLNLPPQNCLAIEDSHIGLCAARAAELPTLITVSTYTEHDDFSGAFGVVSDLGEPEAPCRHISGLPLTGSCINLKQLRLWHKNCNTGKASAIS